MDSDTAHGDATDEEESRGLSTESRALSAACADIKSYIGYSKGAWLVTSEDV